jgi:hypothetical protein
MNKKWSGRENIQEELGCFGYLLLEGGRKGYRRYKRQMETKEGRN